MVPVRSLSENFVIGQRVSHFLSGNDGEAGDIAFIVNADGKGPLEVRLSSPQAPGALARLNVTKH